MTTAERAPSPTDSGVTFADPFECNPFAVTGWVESMPFAIVVRLGSETLCWSFLIVGVLLIIFALLLLRPCGSTDPPRRYDTSVGHDRSGHEPH